jgi:hypothetical protein
MTKDRILITVKTYPTLSRKYGETVCTAGVRSDGSWLRLYPVPFRRLDEREQYSKFDWVEVDLIRGSSDARPETRHPAGEFKVVGHLGTEQHWLERRELITRTAKVFTSLQLLIDGAKANELSLAVFKPKRLLDFVVEEDDRDWDPAKVDEMRRRTNQGQLFGEAQWQETFRLVNKLPYNFSYRLEDDAGRSSELQILDWEIGALYWNCLRSCEGDEGAAIAKVRMKYWNEFTKNDLHLFLGTTQAFHFVSPNPWVIVGVFPLPYERQTGLF